MNDSRRGPSVTRTEKIKSKKENPQKKPIMLRMDIKALMHDKEKTDTRLTLHRQVLKKFLQDNEKKKEPITNFQCFRDCFMLEQLPDATQAGTNDKYKNAYIFIRTEKKKSLEENLSDPTAEFNIELYFINEHGANIPLSISEMQQTTLGAKENQESIGKIPLDVSLYEKDKNGKFKISDARHRRYLADSIRTISHHQSVLSGAEYPVIRKGQEYSIQFVQPAFRRKAKLKTDKQEKNAPVLYEFYEPLNFYSELGKAIHDAIVVVEPNGNIKNKDLNDDNVKRIVKIEEMNDEEFKQLASSVKLIKRSSLSYKDPIKGRLTRVSENAFQPTNMVFTARKKIPGSNLEKIIEVNPNLIKKFAWKIGFHILQDYFRDIESENLVHTDLKPRNVLLHFVRNETGEIVKVILKIIDKEDAKSVYSNEIRLGTTKFFSPEIKSNEPANLTKESDRYALGLLQMSVFTGEEVNNYLGKRDAALQTIKDEYGDALYHLLSSMTDNDMHKRPSAQNAIATFLEIQPDLSKALLDSPSLKRVKENMGIPSLRAFFGSASTRSSGEIVRPGALQKKEKHKSLNLSTLSKENVSDEAKRSSFWFLIGKGGGSAPDQDSEKKSLEPLKKKKT
ncbi:MAG TPA: protein kinase [Gammaproteobacteria bacterium]|nr:protein kinase [Gammaproteobacteria bacterium]